MAGSRGYGPACVRYTTPPSHVPYVANEFWKFNFTLSSSLLADLKSCDKEQCDSTRETGPKILRSRTIVSPSRESTQLDSGSSQKQPKSKHRYRSSGISKGYQRTKVCTVRVWCTTSASHMLYMPGPCGKITILATS